LRNAKFTWRVALQIIDNKRLQRDLFPLFNERCGYNAMIKFMTISELKG